MDNSVISNLLAIGDKFYFQFKEGLKKKKLPSAFILASIAVATYIKLYPFLRELKGKLLDLGLAFTREGQGLRAYICGCDHPMTDTFYQSNALKALFALRNFEKRLEANELQSILLACEILRPWYMKNWRGEALLSALSNLNSKDRQKEINKIRVDLLRRKKEKEEREDCLCACEMKPLLRCFIMLNDRSEQFIDLYGEVWQYEFENRSFPGNRRHLDILIECWKFLGIQKKVQSITSMASHYAKLGLLAEVEELFRLVKIKIPNEIYEAVGDNLRDAEGYKGYPDPDLERLKAYRLAGNTEKIHAFAVDLVEEGYMKTATKAFRILGRKLTAKVIAEEITPIIIERKGKAYHLKEALITNKSLKALMELYPLDSMEKIAHQIDYGDEYKDYHGIVDLMARKLPKIK